MADNYDPARNPDLNGIWKDGVFQSWAKAFPRDYSVIFDHPRPLVPAYRLED